MENPNIAFGKLHEAKIYVQEVITELDQSESPCEHCGVTKKNNWEEAKLARELEAVVNKLGRLQDRLVNAES